MNSYLFKVQTESIFYTKLHSESKFKAFYRLLIVCTDPQQNTRCKIDTSIDLLKKLNTT